VDFALSDEQQRIREAIAKLCTRFPDEYWLKRDREGGFPSDFHQVLARDGWLGVAMPEEFGGAGLGHRRGRGDDAGDRRVGRRVLRRVGRAHEHLRPQPGGGVRHRRRRRSACCRRSSGRAARLLRGDRANTGLNTKKIKTKAEKRGDKYIVSGQKVWISTAQVAEKVLLLAQTSQGLTLFYTDLDRRHVEVREIDKMGRHAVDSNQLFFDALPVPRRTASARRARASSTSCTA
jgi:acyl-CoA dehydrogenase